MKYSNDGIQLHNFRISCRPQNKGEFEENFQYFRNSDLRCTHTTQPNQEDYFESLTNEKTYCYNFSYSITSSREYKKDPCRIWQYTTTTKNTYYKKYVRSSVISKKLKFSFSFNQTTQQNLNLIMTKNYLYDFSSINIIRSRFYYNKRRGKQV